MKHLKISIKIAIFFVIVCGLIYPLCLTGIGQAAMHNKANGSLIYVNDKVVGSALVGQEFNNHKFFTGRPSTINYDCSHNENGEVPSTGDVTYGPNSQTLKTSVNKAIDKFLKENPTIKREDLPADLFTESASGLDPDISLKAAQIQVESVNKAIDKFLKENPTIKREDLPADLFTESASGLDPDISLKAAQIQVDRVSKNTGISKEELNKFIMESKEKISPEGTVLINVLDLNLNVAKTLKLI